MGIRRHSRELALQALFDMDMGKDDSAERFERFCRNFEPSSKTEPFFMVLVEGVKDHQQEIDRLIEQNSSNWKIHRISCVDRNVMRIAIFEMLHCPDIPVKVSINEAIDIGKKFGTDESGAFINGILDSIHLTLPKKPENGNDQEPSR